VQEGLVVVLFKMVGMGSGPCEGGHGQVFMQRA
jgi:hypothetical protein